MILSAAVVDKDGAIYVARQYCEMTRAKVEALYTAFSRLTTKGKQHTIIEKGDIRYIYQAINEFYCVLITDKHSNILEDIKTLRLFVVAITEYASVGRGLVNEESITHNRFDLLFVFDEIVALGTRQIDNIAQLRTVMEMRSEEERAFVETRTKKEKEAKAIAAEKSKELDQQRRNEMLADRSSRMLDNSFQTQIKQTPKPTDTVEEEQKPSKQTKVISRGKALKLKVNPRK